MARRGRMPLGRVRWFSEERGFGFVEAGEEGLPVDHTGILGDGFRTLEEGAPVRFEVVEDGRGRRRAVRVEALGASPEAGREDR